jgi:hypothetical protein
MHGDINGNPADSAAGGAMSVDAFAARQRRGNGPV